MARTSAPKLQHYVYVCATCDHDPAVRDSPAAADGKALLAAVRKAVKAADDMQGRVRVKSVKCMGGCERPCSVGLTAEGKQACLFTGMSAERVKDVLALVRLHMKSPIGRVRITDPELEHLRAGYLCRIPQARG